MIAPAARVEVKETGVIFQPHSIHAISEGRKTQTRRVIKHKIEADMKFAHEDGGGNWIFWSGLVAPNMSEFTKKAYPNGEGIPCPYGKRGDRVYVKESVWAYSGSGAFHYSSDEPPPKDSAHFGFQWHCHQMPKKAARLWLEITDVRVERLQEISAADAKAEGAEPFLNRDATAWRAGFQLGWDAINARRGYSWASNPWCWVISFRKL